MKQEEIDISHDRTECEKALSYILKAKKSTLVFMEEENLLNQRFLVDILGFDLSKTIVIMDESEELTTKAEAYKSAEFTFSQLETVKTFVKQ